MNIHFLPEEILTLTIIELDICKLSPYGDVLYNVLHLPSEQCREKGLIYYVPHMRIVVKVMDIIRE